MAVRQIVKIDEEKCDGCGQCIIDCAEGALQIIDGKARLIKESYCDGLGACLGGCPTGALTIEERDANEFDEQAVQQHLARAEEQPPAQPELPCGCPGSAVRQMEQPAASPARRGGEASQLRHWPVQLTLVPPNAPFLQGVDLLLAADCVPFALPDFHARFLQGRSVLVGCPKLDNPQAYVEKLTAILQQSSIRSLTVIHMEVPCCTGLWKITEMAVEASGAEVPVEEVTVSVDGRVLTAQNGAGGHVPLAQVKLT